MFIAFCNIRVLLFLYIRAKFIYSLLCSNYFDRRSDPDPDCTNYYANLAQWTVQLVRKQEETTTNKKVLVIQIPVIIPGGAESV